MQRYDSLTHILKDVRDNDREILFIDGDKDESTLSFGALWDQALGLLATLQAQGLGKGDELVIFSRSNRRFVIAFWAAILGGIVPVPVAVGISDEHRLKLFRILTQLQRGTLYTDADLHERLGSFASRMQMDEALAALQKTVIAGDDNAGDTAGEVVDTIREDLAFIQYSSGSTSDPKGVCLTHGNLTANIRAIVEGCGWNEGRPELELDAADP